MCLNIFVDQVDYTDMSIADMESLIETAYHKFREEMADKSKVMPSGVNTRYKLKQMFM